MISILRSANYDPYFTKSQLFAHIYEQFPSGKRVVMQAVKPAGSLHLLLAGLRESEVMEDALWCS